MPAPKKSLAKKLAEASLAVGELVKEGDNGEYTFLRAYDVMKAIRGELFKRGVVIIPAEIVSVDRIQPYYHMTQNMVDEVRVRVRYEITDGHETIKGEGTGIGQDFAGKALYMALTGSLKFFLQGLGLIAGIPDDPEESMPDDMAIKIDEAEKKYGPDLREHPISRRDILVFGRLCDMRGIDQKRRKEYLTDNFAVPVISKIKRKDAVQALNWARSGSEPLAEYISENGGMDESTD